MGGGSWKIFKPIAIAWLKVEDACIFCNVIEILLWRKWPRQKEEGL
jgi:hypothetical protein